MTVLAWVLLIPVALTVTYVVIDKGVDVWGAILVWIDEVFNNGRSLHG